jgi:integrase/recombinase XerD
MPGLLSPSAQRELEAYARHLQQEADLSAASTRNYLGDLGRFMAWYEQVWSVGTTAPVPFSLEGVTTPTLTHYRAYLKEHKGLKPATVNRYLVSLKRYFAWAVSARRVQRNPARAVKLVDQIPQPPRHLSDREEADLVAAAERAGKPRDIALITLMLHTGLRVGEVCALKWEDIVLHERSGTLAVWGKGSKQRVVPLNVTARTVLSQFHAQLIAQGKAGQGYVFTSQRTGNHVTPRGLRFIIDKYARQAGIADLAPHDLRHRFAYRMAEKVPVHRLAQLMGHDSLDTTLVYIQGTPRDLQRAVETIAWQ